LDAENTSRFNSLFGEIEKQNPLKYALVKETYAYVNQPVPRISHEKLGLPNGNGSEEDYYNAFLLSRIANLPISRTYRNHSVSEWIRSMLYTYYRAHNILIPNSEELRLGDTRKYVTGALTMYEFVRELELNIHMLVKTVLVHEYKENWWRKGVPEKMRGEIITDNPTNRGWFR
jgi:hypothetical protein